MRAPEVQSLRNGQLHFFRLQFRRTIFWIFLNESELWCETLWVQWPTTGNLWGSWTEAWHACVISRYLSHQKWNESLSLNLPRNFNILENWNLDNHIVTNWCEVLSSNMGSEGNLWAKSGLRQLKRKIRVICLDISTTRNQMKNCRQIMPVIFTFSIIDNSSIVEFHL